MNDLDTSIRTLDPAPTEFDDVHRRRADALLERIVAHDPNEVAETVRPPRHPWRIAAVALAGATAAVIAVALVVIPQGPSAVASWTPEAKPLSAGELQLAEDACRSQLGYVDQIDEMPVVLSERRGDVVALLFWRANPDTSSFCVADFPVGSSGVGEVQSGSAGGSGPASVPSAGTFMVGAIAGFVLDGGALSAVDGPVGDGVVGITVRAGDVEAEATITNGRYSAWLPGNAFTETDQPSGQGGPELVLEFDLTLADGTVIVNAQGARP
jgi:hypothetical protein